MRAATIVLSLAMIGIGVAMLVQGLAAGPATIGVLLGALFIAAGAARIYLLTRKP